MRELEATHASSVAEAMRDVERLLEACADDAPPSLAAAVRLALKPGKRVRPRVALLSCVACDGDARAALDAAVAVELLHASSLVVDDVLDESPLRRHMPSVAAEHGMRVAILAGGWLLSRAMRMAAPTDPEALGERLPDVHATLITFEDVVRAEAAAEGGEADWHDVALGKTASVFGLAAELGARRAGRVDLAPVMRTYGVHLGVAFQASDDILDVAGDARIAGKPVRADASRGAPNLADVVGVAAARVVAARHAALAVDAVAALPCGETRDALVELARGVVDRER